MPRVMEEKWFVFTENECVYFFRSWTGSAVYEVTLEPTENGGRQVSAAWIAAPHGPPVDGKQAAQQLSRLFDVLFFGRY